MIIPTKPITTPTEMAEAQLQRYICLSEGKYHIGIDQPELTGTVTTKKGYKAEYKYEANGIIRYQFTIEQKVEELSHAPLYSKNESLNNNEISASIGSIIAFATPCGVS